MSHWPDLSWGPAFNLKIYYLVSSARVWTFLANLNFTIKSHIFEKLDLTWFKIQICVCLYHFNLKKAVVKGVFVLFNVSLAISLVSANRQQKILTESRRASSAGTRFCSFCQSPQQWVPRQPETVRCPPASLPSGHSLLRALVDARAGRRCSARRPALS